MTTLRFVSMTLAVMGFAANGFDLNTVDIEMPGIRPPRVDYYACTAVPVTNEAYIVKYEALAEAATAHHILLYGCEEPGSTGDYWEGATPCRGAPKILFAWAKNANPTELPDDVGFHIGGDSQVNYLVLNVHYARTLEDDETDDHSGLRLTLRSEAPKYQQGIYLLVNGAAVIPPKTPVFPVDISCRYEGNKDLYAFAYRTHAHSLSRVISGYKKSDPGEWELLGKGNPQWPQMFYKMDSIHVIKPADLLVGRCVYNSTDSDHPVKMAAAHTDEMCNFYIMYYTVGNADFLTCINDQFPKNSSQMPADSLIPLPPNATLDAQAHSHHHHLPEAENHVDAEDDTGEPSTSSPVEEMVQVPDEGNTLPYVVEATGWFNPPSGSVLGQISGVDVDGNGSVIIFHRADRIWDARSMTNQNKMAPGLGAIDKTTLWRLDASGNIVEEWGDNMFYMPHGITIDHENNVWLTDVGMHQVFKFPEGEKKSATITLGQLLTPGHQESPEVQFCEPTDVAVLQNGIFFVSDGYCNARILMFSPEGNVLKQFGSPSSAWSLTRPSPQTFSIPHSLALSEELGLLCVADRNNKRVQCYNTNGEYQFVHYHSGDVYAIAFRGNTDKMLLMDASQITSDGHGYLMRVVDNDLHNIAPFKPADSGFGVVHDVAVTRDGLYAYVATINPGYKLHKFAITVNDRDLERASPTGNLETAQHYHNNEGSDTQNGSGQGSEIVSQRVPVIVAIMLAVPVVSVMIILVVCKIIRKKSNNRNGGKFDMGTIFSSRDTAGFAPLTSQEDHYSESEDDVYNSEKRNILN